MTSLRPIQTSLRLAASAALLFALGSAAQSTAAPTLTLPAVLANLEAESRLLREKLPNITCMEVASSKDIDRDGKLKLRVDLTADITVQRAPDGKLVESFKVTTLDGKPFPAGNRLNLPLYMEGGFRMAFGEVSARSQPCYHFTLIQATLESPARLDFEAIPKPDPSLQCEVPPSLKGFALLDANGDLTHIERRISGDAANSSDTRAYHLAPYALVDIRPVTLNGRSYPLSSHVIGELLVGSRTKRFEANYTSCRLFGSTATIIPGNVIADPPATPDAPK